MSMTSWPGIHLQFLSNESYMCKSFAGRKQVTSYSSEPRILRKSSVFSLCHNWSHKIVVFGIRLFTKSPIVVRQLLRNVFNALTLFPLAIACKDEIPNSATKVDEAPSVDCFSSSKRTFTATSTTSCKQTVHTHNTEYSQLGLGLGLGLVRVS